MKNLPLYVRLFLWCILLLTLTSGIYRHDRPIEKYLQLANEEQFDCVGQVMTKTDGNWTQSGSCVLIDSLHLLSAAHCMTDYLKKDTVVDYQGMKIKTYVALGRYQNKETEYSFLIKNTMLKAKSISVHPDYIKNGSCDIALMTLENPLRGVRTTQLNTFFDELHDTVTGVGFGISGPGNQPALIASYHVKLAGQNLVDSIGGSKMNGIPTVLFADFDSPDSKDKLNKMGSAQPLDLEYGIGGGDSGGPVFISKGNKLYIAGIAISGGQTAENVLKTGYYGNIMGWTRVSAFSSWIQEQMK